MVALTKGRTTPERVGDVRSGLAAAAAAIFQGAIVMRNMTDGFLAQGATATGMVAVGMAKENADNATGADGELTVVYKQGRFHFANSAGADEITAANIGDLAWVVDDQTVALTSATNTRSPAGTIEDVDAQGVWVLLDEALTRAAMA
ncbi:MAG: hypothetical protein AAGL96_16015 [Pseudomonadota bacterium]